MINISNSSPIIGIYKITSPSGKIYIGQSTDINNRKKQYLKNYPNNQPKIQNSISKYTFENHKFEIIEECSIELLNERETFWKKYYLEQNNNDWSKMLFCELHDRGGGPKSEETKLKISLSNKGRKLTQETKTKISQGNKGKIRNDELKNKIKNSITGIKRSQETKDKISNSNKGKNKPKDMMKTRYKPVLQYDLDGNFIKEWKNMSEPTKYYNMKESRISSCCRFTNRICAGFKWSLKENKIC